MPAKHHAAAIALDPLGRTGGYATRNGFSHAVWRDGDATYTEVAVDAVRTPRPVPAV